MIQQCLGNEFKMRGLQKQVVTQVVVDRQDLAFRNPTKPMGPFFDEQKAKQYRAELQWDIVEDAGQGWRRVVPSPLPQRIVERDAIQMLVIAAGGGGIPVAEDAEGRLTGVAAVSDKDHASALPANSTAADLFLLSTSGAQVALRYRQPDQVWLDHLTIEEARCYDAEGHFAPGNMKPKIETCLAFLERGGKAALITSPENIERALAGQAGTWITPCKGGMEG